MIMKIVKTNMNTRSSAAFASTNPVQMLAVTRRPDLPKRVMLFPAIQVRSISNRLAAPEGRLPDCSRIVSASLLNSALICC